ncbi:hypothetical protein [Gordonia spumicola]|nr:hypothetical protein [Gordonia spumicola]
MKAVLDGFNVLFPGLGPWFGSGVSEADAKSRVKHLPGAIRIADDEIDMAEGSNNWIISRWSEVPSGGHVGVRCRFRSSQPGLRPPRQAPNFTLQVSCELFPGGMVDEGAIIELVRRAVDPDSIEVRRDAGPELFEVIYSRSA